jgi:2-methylcitrate dehydratase
LAAAEINERSGRDLIAGIVLAYEVFCKVGDVFDYLGNGIDHTTITGMGAVVGAGSLMGLTREQMIYAIGITVGGNTATREGRSGSLSNWKAYAAADACRKAIFSVQLAANGMSGPSTIYEGTYGFFKVFGHKPVEAVQLGEPFGIVRTFMKRFPVGQFAQTVAQAAIQAREFAKNPDDIKEINISVSRSAIKIMADGPDKWHPSTSETADHSIPYSAGLILQYGKIEREHYEERYLHDSKLLNLISRIKVQATEEAEKPGLSNLCLFEVVLVNGAHKTYRVEYHRGDSKNPMTDAELEEKFRQMAQRYLPADRVDRLLKLIWGIDNEPNLDNLISATQI